MRPFLLGFIMITQEYLKNILEYDHHNGNFKWKINVCNVKNRETAGTVRKDGYVKISIDKKQYYAHRLAWLYFYGVYPDKFIDHINGNTNDNKINNLRLATHQQNLTNIRNKPKHNTTGYLGVYFDKKRKKYASQIFVNKKHIHIGYFNDAENAHKAYLDTKRKLHEFCTI